MTEQEASIHDIRSDGERNVRDVMLQEHTARELLSRRAKKLGRAIQPVSLMAPCGFGQHVGGESSSTTEIYGNITWVRNESPYEIRGWRIEILRDIFEP